MDETNESTTVAAANGISSTSTTTAWFEFILDETLLERHLSDPNAGERLLGVPSLFAPWNESSNSTLAYSLPGEVR